MSGASEEYQAHAQMGMSDANNKYRSRRDAYSLDASKSSKSSKIIPEGIMRASSSHKTRILSRVEPRYSAQREQQNQRV